MGSVIKHTTEQH